MLEALREVLVERNGRLPHRFGDSAWLARQVDQEIDQVQGVVEVDDFGLQCICTDIVVIVKGKSDRAGLAAIS